MMSTTPRSSRKSQLVVFGPPSSPRVTAQKRSGSTSKKSSVAEAEREVLLQLIPDQVFRIKAKPDGSISVRDGRVGARAAGNGVAGTSVEPCETQPLAGPE